VEENKVGDLVSMIYQAIKKAEEEHPYALKGNHETYSQYNEGWTDACNRIECLLDQITMEVRWKLGGSGEKIQRW